MTLEQLKAKRETLKNRLGALDSKIAKFGQAEREREQRDLLKLIQSRGLNAKQLSQLLDAKPAPVVAEKQTQAGA